MLRVKISAMPPGELHQDRALQPGSKDNLRDMFHQVQADLSKIRKHIQTSPGIAPDVAGNTGDYINQTAQKLNNACVPLIRAHDEARLEREREHLRLEHLSTELDEIRKGTAGALMWIRNAEKDMSSHRTLLTEYMNSETEKKNKAAGELIQAFKEFVDTNLVGLTQAISALESFGRCNKSGSAATIHDRPGSVPPTQSSSTTPAVSHPGNAPAIAHAPLPDPPQTPVRPFRTMYSPSHSAPAVVSVYWKGSKDSTQEPAAVRPAGASVLYGSLDDGDVTRVNSPVFRSKSLSYAHLHFADIFEPPRPRSPEFSDSQIAGSLDEMYSSLDQLLVGSFVRPGRNSIDVRDLSKWPVFNGMVAAYSDLNEKQAISFIESHWSNGTALTRASLLTRVVLEHVIRRLWTWTAWKGHDHLGDERVDKMLAALLDTSGTPDEYCSRRQSALDGMAIYVGDIFHSYGYADLRSRKVRDFAVEIRQLLGPVRDYVVDHLALEENLTALCQRVWDVYRSMVVSAVTFTFSWPECGIRFADNAMISVHPKIDPLELQRDHWRTALVFTPVVIARDDRYGTIAIRPIARANVLCMY